MDLAASLSAAWTNGTSANRVAFSMPHGSAALNVGVTNDLALGGLFTETSLMPSVRWRLLADPFLAVQAEAGIAAWSGMQVNGRLLLADDSGVCASLSWMQPFSWNPGTPPTSALSGTLGFAMRAGALTLRPELSVGVPPIVALQALSRPQAIPWEVALGVSGTFRLADATDPVPLWDPDGAPPIQIPAPPPPKDDIDSEPDQ